MSFRFTIGPSLEKQLDKLAHRDKALALAVRKKIVQIKAGNPAFLEHFKNARLRRASFQPPVGRNLKGPLKEYKRAHVGSFVLLFKIEGNLIIFVELLHHDEAY